MERYIQLLSAAMLACLNGFAQQHPTAFDLRPVVVPGMTIDGHIFTLGTILGTAAINDAGEIAFAAYCDGPKIFTSHRIVAKDGDEIDGKFISILPIDTAIAINNRGDVAFEAWYADTKEEAAAAGWSKLGIFNEKHLAMTRPSDSPIAPFTLTDDGRILLNPEPQAALPTQLPATQKKPGLLDRVRIKAPAGFPISIAPNSQSPPARGGRPELLSPLAALPMLRANGHGQVVIPVNLGSSGFMLLLATPIAH